jgi:D-tyrosyl-tRNA(Tyr) deacylase
MIACLQRCSRAEVRVYGRVVGAIGRGFLVLLGVEKDDGAKTADAMAERLSVFRIFDDDDGKMNRSILDTGGEALLVSQFTLAAATSKGRRPSFDHAAAPQRAEELYERVASAMRAAGIRKVATGSFGATMEVELVNDGPVTFLVREPAKVTA